MTDIPATIDLNPSGGDPEASVLWLHGLGADGNDFVPIVERFLSLQQHKVRFIFPHAPIRSITVNGGMQMRAWYDIIERDFSKEEDLTGIHHSEALVQQLLEREHNLGIPYNKMVLGGFSQGGAIALYTALRFKEPLGGVIALSTYLANPSAFKKGNYPGNQQIPIFMAHGVYDPIIPIMLGQMSREQLENLGYPIQWHSYSMGHSVTPEEIQDIDRFLGNTIGKL